jgi:Lactonase, 7-bladed beta-propeller
MDFMNRFLRSSVVSFVLLTIFVCCGEASAQVNYVVTNDDAPIPFSMGVSIFSVGSSGALTLTKQVRTGGHGIGGGYFGAKRVAVLDAGGQQCVYASEAATGDIVGITVSDFSKASSTFGSATDTGTSNGIGLALNGQYLYASFSDSSVISTFAVEAGCSLLFVNDTQVTGLKGGIVNAIAIHGNMLITTCTDGTIQSFDISNGTPVSNGDEQFSSATTTSKGATYPNSIDITGDGRFAIFGDTSTTTIVEVSDISSGRLKKTHVYQSSESISSSNLILSPDETILYVVNTQGAAVTAFFFNSITGVVTSGCKSDRIRGLSANWSYLASAGTLSQSGNGGGVYVAEFGAVSAIAMIKLTVSNGTCTLREATGSPYLDQNTYGLLSIATIPPRSF